MSEREMESKVRKFKTAVALREQDRREQFPALSVRIAVAIVRRCLEKC